MTKKKKKKKRNRNRDEDEGEKKRRRKPEEKKIFVLYGLCEDFFFYFLAFISINMCVSINTYTHIFSA